MDIVVVDLGFYQYWMVIGVGKVDCYFFVFCWEDYVCIVDQYVGCDGGVEV